MCHESWSASWSEASWDVGISLGNSRVQNPQFFELLNRSIPFRVHGSHLPAPHSSWALVIPLCVGSCQVMVQPPQNRRAHQHRVASDTNPFTTATLPQTARMGPDIDADKGEGWIGIGPRTLQLLLDITGWRAFFPPDPTLVLSPRKWGLT